MRTSLGRSELAEYLSRQLNTYFPDGRDVSKNVLGHPVDTALQRVEHCFSRICSKYYVEDSSPLFDHLHADHYATFLYFTAAAIYRQGADERLCAKLVHLNKCLHGLDLFYEVELPDIFLLVHPLGTVLGRAKYADYLVVYQRCGVGSNHGVYPVLGEFVTLRPGASVLGSCRVGTNCTIAADSLLLDRTLDDNLVYIGNPLNHVIKPAGGPSHIWQRG